MARVWHNQIFSEWTCVIKAHKEEQQRACINVGRASQELPLCPPSADTKISSTPGHSCPQRAGSHCLFLGLDTSHTLLSLPQRPAQLLNLTLRVHGFSPLPPLQGSLGFEPFCHLYFSLGVAFLLSKRRIWWSPLVSIGPRTPLSQKGLLSSLRMAIFKTAPSYFHQPGWQGQMWWFVCM